MIMFGSGISPPTVDDVFRYRYQHGTNLGSVFMHGPWLDNSVFEDDPNGSRELEALKSSLHEKGLKETTSTWEAHWLAALTEHDLKWLKDVARCNSIRLPIGFYTLGPAFCLGTGFEGEPSQVYSSCWNTLKHLVLKCQLYGIGVLIDLKNIPGGQLCSQDESSENGSVCDSIHNRIVVRDCLAFIAQEITFHALLGVVGVQISSETDWRTWGHEWYDEVLEITSSINPSLPIYINDGQNLPAALDYAILRNRLPAPVNRSPIIVESHRHYTTESDQLQGPQAIIGNVSRELIELATHHGKVVSQGTAVDIYIGEYSCHMDDRTWEHTDTPERDVLTKSFGQEQTKQWTSKTCGSAFYRFKSGGACGMERDFEQQVNIGSIPAPAWLIIPRDQIPTKVDQAKSQRPQLQNKFLSQTSRSMSPHGRRRFSLGWDLGFNDALCFFTAIARDVIPGRRDGGDKIGALDLWIRKRVIEATCFGEDLDVEWESGFRTGVDDFYNAVGI
ncbi:glycoside hydrolase [Aspergillus steynii IBT 23096]|uniref:Glycoside hydrolase n=1 Tax=Aspergillus steynii IBT 23096 TaxID=1392250 RepID=A0A2I2G1N6_9EURO|nr:glycoside hydrolase [Aspergillus steynii IBT 23096]PLB46792.1 glycoside hydrolase [Aspergillus steynii IBT 23096]